MRRISKKIIPAQATSGHFDHDIFMEKLGKRIRVLRKSRGFSAYEQFAAHIDISRAGMFRYESGTLKDIKMSTLLKIIDGLGMTPKKFFSRLD